MIRKYTGFIILIFSLLTLFSVATVSTETLYGAFAPRATTITVTSRLDSGAGSLRQALLSASAGDTISFDAQDFPANNPKTITLLSALPEIAQGNLTIDGSNAGVVLDGQLIVSYTDGFRITSDGNVIKGVQIINFSGDGIEITNGAKHNLIGGDSSVGSAPHGEGNIITLNGGHGVHINGTGTMNNTVSGNLIGLDVDGTQDVRVQAMVLSPRFLSLSKGRSDQTLFFGSKYHGVWKSTDGGSNWATVNSGLTSLDVRALAISPNYAVDSTLFASTINGRIFKSSNGGASWARVDSGASEHVMALAISPNYANDGQIFAATKGQGVLLSSDGGNSWSERNNGFSDPWVIDIVLSPNYSADQTLFAARWNEVYKSVDEGNSWSETSPNAISAIGSLAISPDYANDQTIFVTTVHCSSNQVRKSTDGGNSWLSVGDNAGWCAMRGIDFSPNYAVDQTLFIGDYWNGIFKSTDRGATWSQVHSSHYNDVLAVSPNYAQDQTILAGQVMGHLLKSVNQGSNWSEIGSLTERGNKNMGVLLSSQTQGNRIGGSTPGTRNVISHNNVVGVHVRNATDNLIIGNYIGTTLNGDAPLGNGAEGVIFESGSSNNQLGDTGSAEGNLVSGNRWTGVQVRHSGTTHNTIVGNYVGTDSNGSAALANGSDGVVLRDGSQHNQLGGTSAAERNIISGNELNGVGIWNSGTTNNTVIGNYVGTDVSGLQALPNYGGVVFDDGAQYNRIGGTTAAERNVISGNNQVGVNIGSSNTMHNTIVGNYVGINANATGVLANLIGINCWGGAQQNLIQGNVASGNQDTGIRLDNCHNSTIIGNYVGTDMSGTLDLGNAREGIALYGGSTQNVVGEGNVVAYNDRHGVLIWPATSLHNTITQNSIYSNSSKGIHNENAVLSPPALTEVTPNSVTGVAPVAHAIIEIFSDSEDEGRVYEGSTTADADGGFTFSKSCFVGPNLSATATDADGNTSEFSPAVAVAGTLCGGTPTPTPNMTPTSTPSPGAATNTPTPTASHTATATPIVTFTPTPSTLIISNLRTSNQRDVSFVVSWLTNMATDGQIRYGTDPNQLNQSAHDTRGANTNHTTHYVLVDGLEPETTYYFDLISGNLTDDNDGTHYQITTAPTRPLPANDLIFGQTFKANGTTFAEGALVIITLQDKDDVGSPGSAAPLSALVDSDGFWSANLGNARTADLSDYFYYLPSGDQVLLEAYASINQRGCQTVDTANDSPAQAIVLDNAPCTTTHTSNMHIGWNHIALPLEPVAPLSAEDICDQIDSQGGDVVEIDRWHAGGWDGHLCQYPFNDFTLTVGVGYFIKSNRASTWTIQGEPINSPVPLALQTGWNSIAVPHTDAYIAQSLCDQIESQAVTPVEIDRWYTGGWNGHICDQPFNNFQIEPGTGYFVKTNSSGTVIPNQPSLLRQAEQIVPVSPQDIPAGKALPVHNLQISNLRDTSLTLSWTTDEPTTGYVRFGRGEEGNPSTLRQAQGTASSGHRREGLPLQEGNREEGNPSTLRQAQGTASSGHRREGLPLQESRQVAYDTRGAITSSKTHYVVLDNLTPDTTYEIEIISGGAASRGNASRLPSVSTAPVLERVPDSDTIYGQAFYADGVTPAKGTTVYLQLEDRDQQGSPDQATLISALVDQNGYWHANLGNARTADGTQPFTYSANDRLTLVAQAGSEEPVTQTLDLAALPAAAPLLLSPQTRLYLPLMSNPEYP